MRRIRWTLAAVADLETLIDYIHQDDPVAAEALAQRVFDGLEKLCGFPGIGRPGNEHGTRELIVYPLIVSIGSAMTSSSQ